MISKITKTLRELAKRLAVFIICFCVTEALATGILVVMTDMSFWQCLTVPIIMSIAVGGWCSKSELGNLKES